MLRYYLFLFVLLVSLHVAAQSDSIKVESPFLKKNSVFISLGAGTEFYFAGTMAYEYIFWQNRKALHVAIGGQVGYSLYAVWGIGGSIINVNLVGLIGAGKNHLEITGGANVFLNGDLKGYDPYVLSANAGYRFQSPLGGVIFKVGTGWPEVFYIGLGYNF